ncbi:MAG: LysR family transcriptional regulator [Klebsiella pneumoniae]|nr:LysR family transcriptional regulator [Klebsiella pneumoniae]
MSDPDFNLLVALDVLLSEASVAGAARRLNLSTSAMSRTLSRLRDVTGDPILVRAGRNMVLTPWAEATRDRARRAVHDARAVLQPSTETFSAQNLARLFTIRANDGFVVAFGPALIAAVADAAPDVCIRFAPKPEKTSRYLREGLVDLEIGVQSNMGPEGALHGSVDDALAELGTKRKIASVVPGFPTALSVALESDLIAMIPALYLLNQQVTDQVHLFELPFKSRRITVSQMWHPRMERDPGHRWLREQILAICGVENTSIEVAV